MAVRFRLARILRLRTQLRRLAEDEVARTGARLAALHDDVAAVRREQEASHAAAERAVRGGLAGAELHRWGQWGDALHARETALADESARVAEELVGRRGELVARRRDERQLERLGERTAARGRLEEERANGRLLDELALRRHGRR
jgi:flagellar export protein FliJ